MQLFDTVKEIPTVNITQSAKPRPLVKTKLKLILFQT